MSWLEANGLEKTVKKVVKALDHLNESLTPEWWINDSHLNHKDGKRVFQAEKLCAKKLMEVFTKPDKYELSPEDTLGWEGWITTNIVKADELLALIVFSEAKQASIDEKTIDHIEKKLSDAYSAIDEGKFDKVCKKFGIAWKEATDALDKAIGGTMSAGDGTTSLVFALSQNFPNPFSSVTSIQYSVPRSTYITLKIYDVTGRPVRTLVDETVEAGYHTVEWDAKNLLSGIYCYRLTAGDYTEMKKMIILR